MAWGVGHGAWGMGRGVRHGVGRGVGRGIACAIPGPPDLAGGSLAPKRVSTARCGSRKARRRTVASSRAVFISAFFESRSCNGGGGNGGVVLGPKGLRWVRRGARWRELMRGGARWHGWRRTVSAALATRGPFFAALGSRGASHALRSCPAKATSFSPSSRSHTCGWKGAGVAPCTPWVQAEAGS